MSLFDIVLQKFQVSKKSLLNWSDLEICSSIPRMNFLAKGKFLEQRSSPNSSDPRNLKGRIQKGFKMKIRKGTKRMTLFRYLLSKLLYDSGGLHLDEYLCLFELYLQFFESKDPVFISKYGQDLVNITGFIQNLGEQRDFPIHWTRESTSEEIEYAQSFGTLSLTHDGYFGMRGNRDIKSCFRISLEDSLSPQRFPPQRFIGVGYRDKGSRRELQIDGSPSWQEVGSEFTQLEEAFRGLMENYEERLSR
jgi:hypothetical protein